MSGTIPGPLTEAELEGVFERVDDPPTDVRFRKRRTGPRYVAKGDDVEFVLDLENLSRGGRLTNRIKRMISSDKSPGRGQLLTVQRALDLVAERTDLPAPAVVHYEPDPDNVSMPYLLTRRVAGESYDNDGMNRLDDDVIHRVVTEAGRHLAAMHEAASFDEFGDLQATDDGLEADGQENWAEYLRVNAEQNLSRIEGSRFDDLVPGIQRYIDEMIPDLQGSFKPVLDVKYRLGSLTIQPDDGIATVNIGGWEMARAVQANYSLLEAEESLINRRFADESRRVELRERLYGGYKTVRPEFAVDERRADLYRVTARLYALAALPYWLDSAPEELVETRARRHREFVQQYVDEIE